MRGRAVGALAFAVAVLCALVSVVVQLGESIRYQNARPPDLPFSYSAGELTLILGLPLASAIAAVLGWRGLRRTPALLFAVAVVVLAVYHLAIVLGRLRP